MRDTRSRRDVHGLTGEGMLACNPRDREAAHRAQMGGIAAAGIDAVTCRKCLTRLQRERREGGVRREGRPGDPGSRARAGRAGRG